MTPHKIDFDMCSRLNIITRASLLIGWEKHKVPDAHMPRLAGADKSSLKLSGPVWLHVRLRNNLYRVQFVIAVRLLVSMLLCNVFNNRQVRWIDIGNQRLILGPKGLVPILLLERHDIELESNPESSKKSLLRKGHELDTDGFQTHIVQLTRRLVTPAHTHAVAQAITAAGGLVYVKSRPSN